MLVTAGLNEASVSTEPLSERADGTPNIQELAWAGKTIDHMIRGTIMKVVEVVSLSFVGKGFLAMLDKIASLTKCFFTLVHTFEWYET